jgi:hypothetical protein
MKDLFYRINTTRTQNLLIKKSPFPCKDFGSIFVLFFSFLIFLFETKYEFDIYTFNVIL